jgi:5-methylthioadenosine/S-adenosylhomocysteine deaminase
VNAPTALTALTVVNGRLGGERIGLRVVGGTIHAIGPHVVAEPDDEVLDAADGEVQPGLVNGHTHAAMTLFRGWGDDLPLMEWLRDRIWPAEARVTPDDVYWGSRLAFAEMLRTGTTRCWDMYWHGDAVARAAADAGIRAVVSSVVVDGGDPDRGRALRPAVLDQLDALADHGPRIVASLGPHAVYTVSPATLTWVGEVAEARGVPVQIHLAETEDEVLRCRAEHGLSPAALLDRCGLLGPSTVLAHGVWLDDDDLDLIAARGAAIVTNPVSNMKLGVGGVFDYAAARGRGIPVGLGTDGAASNNSLDLLADTKFLSLLQKHDRSDAASMPASEAWAVATGARAPVLGQSDALVPGGPADFLLIGSRHPELGPGDLVHNLVYAATGRVVDTVVVGGRVVVRHGVVADEDEVRERAFACAARLGVSGDPVPRVGDDVRR